MKINQIIKKLGHIKESLKECTKETNNQVIYDIDHQIARLEILIDDIDSFGVDDCDCGGEYDENSNLFEKLKKEFATALVYSKPWNDGAMLLNDVAIFDVLEHVFKEKK